MACDSTGGGGPSLLLDGSPASPPPVALEGVAGPAVLSRVRSVASGRLEQGSAAAACLGQQRSNARVLGPLVERVGVTGASVTFRDRSARGVYGCDASSVDSNALLRWCGVGFGTLYSGRLRDPRLDLVCVGEGGTPVGFAWVQPARDARYVAVRQRGYVEVYALAGGLPVRVATTSDIDVERSYATFQISEHDARGRLLRRYELEAAVAG
jgi:hypothetical protein